MGGTAGEATLRLRLAAMHGVCLTGTQTPKGEPIAGGFLPSSKPNPAPHVAGGRARRRLGAGIRGRRSWPRFSPHGRVGASSAVAADR